MTHEVSGRATFNREDYLALYRSKTQWGIPTLLAAMGLLLLAVRVLTAAFGAPFPAWGHTLSWAVLAGLAALVLWAQATWARSGAEASHDPREGETTYRFGPGGISMADAFTTLTSRWSRYERVVELPAHYLLEPPVGPSVVIPRRAFATPHDEATFRFLVRAAGLPIETHGPPRPPEEVHVENESFVRES